MSNQTVFDSRDLRYKDPFGAVSSGKSVTFHIRPPRKAGFSRGIIRIFWEYSNQTEEYPLIWDGIDGSQDVFSITLSTKAYIGLIWYSFRFERLDGTHINYGPNGWTHDLPLGYQLTVYQEDSFSPDWFGQGVTYQIFPDRFFRAQEIRRDHKKRDAYYHQNWDEAPHFLPDSNGEIRNRDFFGGTLQGIEEKLDYLEKLGITTLYLCPIFEAAENHRYGTGDYESIDPILGTREEFEHLCQSLHQRHMHLILDGVFSHTGFISKYFNGDGSYPSLGAYQSKESPYYSWYRFQHWPEQYDAWWGIYSLPEVQETEPSYLNYMIQDENSIVKRWLRAGADGWRLDVADELPDSFIQSLYTAVRQTKPQAVVIGEVWEDGSNKISYGTRRRYLLGGHLDGLMNYPFRSALLTYINNQDAKAFFNAMETLRENYPSHVFYNAMNSLGTHDTPRILTMLGADPALFQSSKTERSVYRLDKEKREKAISLLKLAYLILFTFPGSPTIYYGDEVGMEGFEDPFNRNTFPWGKEDHSILSYVKILSHIRGHCDALRIGSIRYLEANGPLLIYAREVRGQALYTAVNCGTKSVHTQIPIEAEIVTDLISQTKFKSQGDGILELSISPMSGLLLMDEKR